MKYRILQIKNLAEADYRFMRYDFATRNGFDLADYACVYEAEAWTAHDDEELQKFLEFVFVKFNADYPLGFKGHSLSVSDIIEVERDGEVRRFYVEPVGFIEL